MLKANDVGERQLWMIVVIFALVVIGVILAVHKSQPYDQAVTYYDGTNSYKCSKPISVKLVTDPNYKPGQMSDVKLDVPVYKSDATKYCHVMNSAS